jgi:hypothetical protein
MVRLWAGDIDSTRMIIRVVQSKGRKARHLMLLADVLDLLRQWWKARPTRCDAGVAPEQCWLFPGRSDPLTAREFGRLFKQATKAAGLRKALSLRSLRHSFATHLLEHGKDIRLIQAVAWTRQAAFDDVRSRTPPKFGSAARSGIDLGRKQVICKIEIALARLREFTVGVTVPRPDFSSAVYKCRYAACDTAPRDA